MRKLQQLMSYFANKNGGSIDLYTLIRLINAAQERSVESYDFPILRKEYKAEVHEDDEFSLADIDIIEDVWLKRNFIIDSIPQAVRDEIIEYNELDRFFEKI